MLRLVAVHNHAALSFELPCALVHIEHNHVHAQIHGSLLCAEASAERGVEENHQESLVLTKVLEVEAASLHVEGFLHSGTEVAYIADRFKISHSRSLKKQ